MLQNASVNGPLMMYEKASGVVNETRYFEVLLRRRLSDFERPLVDV